LSNAEPHPSLAELSKRLSRDFSTPSSAAKKVFVLSNMDAEMGKRLEDFKHGILKIGQLPAPAPFEGGD
jgi:hypothetical protein